MDYLSLSLKDLAKAIKNNEITPLELTKLALARAKEYQSIYNPFVTITEEEALKLAETLTNSAQDNPLYGIPFALKDNFSTKGILTTGSSNILSNYVPVYDATVVQKLKKANAVLIGKTVLDELAMGGTSMSGHTGYVINPYSKTLDHMAGGSSGGSAVSVASGIVPYALGSDTGDSVRKPASYCGIVGFKPTYGRISRFGLFPFAPSLDHVAFFTRTVEDSAYVLEALAGNDPKDMTSAINPVESYAANLTSDVKGKKVAVIKEIVDSLNDSKIKELFDLTVKKASEAGMIVEYVSMDEKLLRAILPIYLVISCAEATSNNANLDGVKFGPRVEGATVDETIINTRTYGFSELIKRRFVMGSYFLKKENQERLFLKAQKIRRLIVDKTNEILKSYDAILLPAAGSTAPKFTSRSDEKLSNKYLIAENHLAIGNFGGFPSITIPAGLVDDMPFGVNLTGKVFDEQNVLNLAYALESKLDYKNKIVARGGK
jgi:aspartyl-tRNA(Asn)/glutamyl-tRNA(Gln) amidotransferase subunit A